MKTYTIRLLPGQDLKEELLKFTNIHNIQAGCILTCVGSLRDAIIRLANEQVIRHHGPFEIVSLVGTISQDGIHMHISIADSEGKVLGGHLKDGCIILTTAEIIVGELENTRFYRKEDKITGFKELIIENKEK